MVAREAYKLRIKKPITTTKIVSALVNLPPLLVNRKIKAKGINIRGNRAAYSHKPKTWRLIMKRILSGKLDKIGRVPNLAKI